MDQFVAQVGLIREDFEGNKDNPPVSGDDPPVTRRIKWARTLHEELKQAAESFRVQREIDTELGQNACKVYVSLSRELQAFEEFWYHHWNKTSIQTIDAILEANVFIKGTAANELGPDPEQNTDKTVVRVNLPPELMEMTLEAIELEELGLRVHEKLRVIALLRENFLEYSEMLHKILDQYYAIRRRVRSPELKFMDKHITDLELNFEQGLNFWKWTSLGIPDYGQSLRKVMQKFDKTISEINVLGNDIRARLLEAKTLRLTKEPPYDKYAIMTCQKYFRFWTEVRATIWAKLLRLYKGISPALIGMEDLAYSKKSGKHRLFRSEYIHWEKCMFKYLAKVVIRSLHEFEIRMTSEDNPLFDVDAILVQPEIRISPSAHEIFQMLATGAKDCVEGTKKFYRWKRGSCLEVTPIRLPGGAEPFVYSMYTDIGRLPRVLQLLLQIQENFQGILRNLWQYLKKYQEFTNLWIYDKNKTAVAFGAKGPSAKTYYEKMAFYSMMGDRVLELPQYRIEGCVRLNLRPLHHSIAQHTRAWIAVLGEQLLASTRNKGKDFKRKVTDFVAELHVQPRNVQDLKKLLISIQTVQSLMVNAEVRYRDLLERYSVLRYYKVNYPEEELTAVEGTWRRWMVLCFHELRSIKKRVDPLKKRFKL